MYPNNIQISFASILGVGKKNEMVFLRLKKKKKKKKKLSSWSLAMKTTLFTQYLSYLNPKGEDSSCKIDGFMAR